MNVHIPAFNGTTQIDTRTISKWDPLCYGYVLEEYWEESWTEDWTEIKIFHDTNEELTQGLREIESRGYEILASVGTAPAYDSDFRVQIELEEENNDWEGKYETFGIMTIFHITRDQTKSHILNVIDSTVPVIPGISSI